MKRLRQSQQGFSAVEAVFVLIIITALVGIGWYVFRAKNNTNVSLTNATKAQGEPQKATKQIPQSSSSKSLTPTSTTTPTAQNIVKFPELGVQLTVPDAIKDLKYMIDKQTDYRGQTVLYARLSTDSLMAEDKDCAPNSSALGVLTKGLGTYTSLDQQSRDFSDYYDGSFNKQFSGFFIVYGKSHAACGSGSQSVQAVQLQQTQKIQDSLGSIQEIK